MDKPLDPSWSGWLAENLQRGCPPQELLGILLKHGFAVAAIRQAMGEQFPASSFLLGDAAQPIDHEALAALRPQGGKRFSSNAAVLYTIDDFLGPADCDALMALAATHLRPSTVTTGDRDRGYRTSSTCDLGLVRDPLITRVDQLIAATLGLSLPYSEAIQVQRYEVGQEFKRHTDFFAPGSQEYADYAGLSGNRTWTFMVYLNSVERGGGTRFFTLGHDFQPRQGRAVMWNNLNADGTPNPATEHAGLPVEAGHKVIITKWFREIGSGPMWAR